MTNILLIIVLMTLVAVIMVPARKISEYRHWVVLWMSLLLVMTLIVGWMQ